MFAEVEEPSYISYLLQKNVKGHLLFLFFFSTLLAYSSLLLPFFHKEQNQISLHFFVQGQIFDIKVNRKTESV